MKWLKHETDAMDSEKMKMIIYEFGFEGYGWFWRIMEIIAKQMDETGRCHYDQPVSEWCGNLKVKQRKLRKFLELTTLQSITEVVYSENKLRIEIPNLLKKRDNYSKNLQVTNNKKAISIGLEVEVDRDREVDITHITNEVEIAFKEDWIIYPRKAGNKAKALKCYRKTVGNDLERNRPLFLKKMQELVASVEDPGYLPHGETFFRNWVDIEVCNIRPMKNETFEEKHERKMSEARERLNANHS
jgi:uncharacterized alkaline shock family protein YloU